MIPGSNILNQALTVIAKQTVQYYRMLDRAVNDVGQDVTEYAPPVAITGSFQPIQRKLYEQYGLDFQKSYFILYASKNIIDVGRNVSGDQITFQGRRYQCESETEWFGIDGWVGVICVDQGTDLSVLRVYGFDQPQNFGNGNFLTPGVV